MIAANVASTELVDFVAGPVVIDGYELNFFVYMYRPRAAIEMLAAAYTVVQMNAQAKALVVRAYADRHTRLTEYDWYVRAQVHFDQNLRALQADREILRDACAVVEKHYFHNKVPSELHPLFEHAALYAHGCEGIPLTVKEHPMQRKPLVAVNVTPLVDVLLILLVILMLAMPLFVKKLPVELPRTGVNAAPVAANSLRVSLSEKGTLFVGTREATLAQIGALIKENTTVELAVDEKTPYGLAATLIAQLQTSNPKEIVLATR